MKFPRSRYILPLAGLAAFASPQMASATTVWDNGSAGATQSRCNQGNTGCAGQGGWVIYDDFALSGTTLITGFAYDTALNGTTYTGTRYSFWGANPGASFASGPAFSGDAVGTVADLGSGLSRITVSGLSLTLDGGTHWLGLTNLIQGNSTTTYRASGQALLGNAMQSDYSGMFTSTSLPDAAFSISGDVVTAVPEPATWGLMILGFGAVGGTMRRRHARLHFA